LTRFFVYFFIEKSKANQAGQNNLKKQQVASHKSQAPSLKLQVVSGTENNDNYDNHNNHDNK